MKNTLLGRKVAVALEEFTPAEQRRHERGLAEIGRGDYVSLTQLKNELATSHRQSSQKKSKASTKK